MKPLFTLIYFIATFSVAQTPNALLKDFKPFETPRTNCRPGTILRVNEEGVKFVAKDVKQIKSESSNDGTLVGQMTFSHDELLTMLNLNFSSDFVTAEVEIKNAVREFTEQSNVDKVLWDDDIAEDVMHDEKSDYFLIRETVSTKNITFRFSRSSASNIVTGKSSLKEKSGEGIDFPFELSKKFNDLKRFFYLEEKIVEPN